MQSTNGLLAQNYLWKVKYHTQPQYSGKIDFVDYDNAVQAAELEPNDKNKSDYARKVRFESFIKFIKRKINLPNGVNNFKRK